MKKIHLFVLCLLLAGNLYGWGYATHTYIADHTGAGIPVRNLSEIYGALLPDAFNLQISVNGQFLADQTHHNPMAFVNAADKCRLEALAFGFASHNDSWGADFSAHHSSVFYPSNGYAEGKALEMIPAIEPKLFQILKNAGLDDITAEAVAGGLAVVFGHDLAETAVDLMLKRNIDPLLGAKMLSAVTLRTPDYPQLLVKAYAPILSGFASIPMNEAAAFINNAEKEHRSMLLIYAGALCMNEKMAIDVLARQNAAVAEAFLEAYSGVNVTVTPADTREFIVSALNYVKNDYFTEVAATLIRVNKELKDRGIESCGFMLAKDEEETGGSAETVVTAEFALQDNYPNPFNPSTTISFSVAFESPVTLEIYNITGEKVRTLLDNQVYRQGTASVVWDGRNDYGEAVSSGMYISRLVTQGGIMTRKMMMVK